MAKREKVGAQSKCKIAHCAALNTSKNTGQKYIRKYGTKIQKKCGQSKCSKIKNCA